MKSSYLIVALLVIRNLAAQSITGNLDALDANDVVLVSFTLSTASNLHFQSWGYGGSSGAPGGKNAAGTVISPGGFDPYVSLFAGVGPSATFLASNDDGSCPPGTATAGSCPDPTLDVVSLPAGSYTLALSAFDNYSFAENLGTGTLGDLFIGLGNYYDIISGTIRTPNYAFDITATGLTVISVSQTTIVSPPVLTKNFGTAVSIPIGGTATLSFHISNPNALVNLTGVTFTDTLPPGLVVSNPNGLTGSCGGTVTAIPGSNTIQLAGGTLPFLASCDFRVSVTGTSAGVKNNFTSQIDSLESDPGNIAMATIVVGDAFQVRYLANLNVADSFVNLTDEGSNGGFDPAGDICANVYVFGADQQLVACCSCPLTPNHLKTLSGKNDLIHNTLTPGVANEVTVALLVTANPTGNAAACNASAVTASNLTVGLGAYGTTLHALPGGSYGTTETEFSPVPLSATELMKLTAYCGFIQSNGSGFGICGSCKQGAAGASRQY